MRSILAKAVLLCTIVTGGAGLWLVTDARPSPDAAYLLNRLWVERLPKHERDIVQYLAAAEDDATGTALVASAYALMLLLTNMLVLYFFFSLLDRPCPTWLRFLSTTCVMCGALLRLNSRYT